MRLKTKKNITYMQGYSTCKGCRGGAYDGVVRPIHVPKPVLTVPGWHASWGARHGTQVKLSRMG